MTRNLALGARGEDVAADYLTAAGFEIVARNWRCRHGELDIVARTGTTVVFVEVKTRRGHGFGTPAEAVTVAKIRKLRLLAGLWLREHGGGFTSVRVDVLAVLIEGNRVPAITHYEAVL